MKSHIEKAESSLLLAHDQPERSSIQHSPTISDTADRDETEKGDHDAFSVRWNQEDGQIRAQSTTMSLRDDDHNGGVPQAFTSALFAVALLAMILGGVLFSTSQTAELPSMQRWWCGGSAEFSAVTALSPSSSSDESLTTPSSSQWLPLPPVSPVYKYPVCILARVYHAQYERVPTFIQSLALNSHRPRIFFVLTDAKSSLQKLHQLVDDSNRMIGQRMATVLPIDDHNVQAVFPQLDISKLFGYAHTDVALDLLSGDEYMEQCQLLIITNADNLYASFFLDRVESEVEKGYQVIGWDFITRYPCTMWVGTACLRVDDESSDDGTRKLLGTQFLTSYVDLGAVLFNLSLWRKHHFSFLELARDRRINEADGYLFESMVQLQIKRVIIRQVLMMHQ